MDNIILEHVCAELVVNRNMRLEWKPADESMLSLGGNMVCSAPPDYVARLELPMPLPCLVS